MSDVPTNAQGNAVQPTCTSCGKLLQTGWSNTSPRRMMLMPCAHCAAAASAAASALPICPTCGGSGRLKA